ncbi:MAG: VTT domain-containing protein [Candidatus Thorarchaeota archaeon]
MDKTDGIMILLTALLVLYWIITFAVLDIISPLATVYAWLLNVSLTMGYAGAFIVCLLGNATILVPFPYIGVPFILGGLQDPNTSAFVFDPTLVGIIAGAGALIGEMTGYVTGYLGGNLLEEEKRSSFLMLANRYPRITPLVLWFLAVTPLPDDVLVVPLGAAKYPWWKVVIPQFVGKAMFLAAIAWAGRLGLTWLDAFVSGTAAGGIVGRTIETISLFLVIVVFYVILKSDILQ